MNNKNSKNYSNDVQRHFFITNAITKNINIFVFDMLSPNDMSTYMLVVGKYVDEQFKNLINDLDTKKLFDDNYVKQLTLMMIDDIKKLITEFTLQFNNGMLHSIINKTVDIIINTIKSN